MEEKNVYIGFVGDHKVFDSGVQKWPLSFKLDQLDELKKYATNGGNVNIDLVIKTDGGAFLSTFNPRSPENQKYVKNNATETVAAQDESLPF